MTARNSSRHIADSDAYPIDITSGEGTNLVAADGSTYLDFVGGWCVATVPWKHRAIQAAYREAAELGVYIAPMYRWERWEHLAARLTELTPGKLQRTFRCTSGSEAVEFGIKLARAATGRKTIVAFDHVYHGHTFGAATVGTGLTEAMGPGVPDIVKLPLPDEYRNPYNFTGAALSDAIVADFEKIAGNGNVAGFLSEPIFTNAGAVTPPADLYPKLAAACQRHGSLLIMDEVASGFGRTGKLFASEWWNLEPDILCLGKAFSGGFAAIGATMCTDDVFRNLRRIPAYSTFGWTVADTIVTAANVELVAKEKLAERSLAMGERLLETLGLLEQLPHVGLVRGRGLLVGIEIVTDKRGRERDARRADRIVAECQRRHLLIEIAKPGCLFLSPPLSVNDTTLTDGVAILRDVIEQHGK